MDTVGVAVVTFAEDHPVERTVELDVDPDAGLLALDLDVLDLREVWLGGGPDIIVLTITLLESSSHSNISLTYLSLSLVVIEGPEGTPLCLGYGAPAFIEQDAASTTTMFQGEMTQVLGRHDLNNNIIIIK